MITSFECIGGKDHPSEGFKSKYDAKKFAGEYRTSEYIHKSNDRYFAIRQYTKTVEVKTIHIEPIYVNVRSGRGGMIPATSILGRLKEVVGCSEPEYAILSDQRISRYKVWLNDKLIYTFPVRYNIEILRLVDNYLSGKSSIVEFTRKIKPSYGWADSWVGVSISLLDVNRDRNSNG